MSLCHSLVYVVNRLVLNLPVVSRGPTHALSHSHAHDAVL